MSVNNEAVVADHKHREDYEFYSPGSSKEEQGTGKGFLVGLKIQKLTKIIVPSLQYLGAVLGLTGLGYMARNFKNKPKDMKISVYLIHTRLLAQGTVIGMMGTLWSLTRRDDSILLFRSSLTWYDKSDVSEVEQEQDTVTQ